MQFNIDRKSLENVLYAAVQAVPSNSPLPVLAGVHVNAEGEQVKITGTDLNLTILSGTEAEVVDEGEAVFPGKRLYDLIRLLPDCTVSVKKDTEKSAVIEYGANCTQIQLINSEEFPLTPEPDNSTVIELDTKTFLTAAKKVAFAAADEEVHGIFSGVLFDVNPFDGLNLVATDRHRLNWLSIEEGDDEASVVISKEGILKALKLLKGESVEIIISDSLVKFQSGGLELYTRTLSGEFPEYSKIFPSGYEAEVTVSNGEFLDVLKRASLLNSNAMKIPTVHLYTEGGFLYISAEDDKSTLSEKIEAKHEGNIDVSFNTRYLIESLGVIESEPVMKFVKNAVSIEEGGFRSFVVGIETVKEETA